MIAPPGSIVVTIEEATGGAAPSPEYVTSDYRRKLRLDIDFPAPGGEATLV